MAVAESPAKKEIIYSDSDEEPMADNTLQWQWVVVLKSGLEAIFLDNPTVFVAGDLLWYPVEGDDKTRLAPDAMAAFGRPKGYRGSYKQWEEGGIAPQVVFEVLSPENRAGEMRDKFDFHERFGVEEYYLLDPYTKRKRPYRFEGWRRDGLGILQTIPVIHRYVSPRPSIRFDTSDPKGLVIYRPDGERFKTPEECSSRETRLERSEIWH